MTSKKTGWWAYEIDQIIKAASEVSQGVPLSTAAKNHHVPRTTLRRYVQEGGSIKFKKMGRPPVLTKQEEQMLVLWIASVAEAGFPVTKEDLLDSVQKLLKELGRENDFIDDRPGRAWYECFLKRNPSVTSRVAQNLTASRASVTPQHLQKWFSDVFLYLKDKKLDRILQEPDRVFNADESAFF